MNRFRIAITGILGKVSFKEFGNSLRGNFDTRFLLEKGFMNGKLLEVAEWVVKELRGKCWTTGQMVEYGAIGGVAQKRARAYMDSS